MSETITLLIVGAFFILFSVFSMWYLRREYRLRGKLSVFGSREQVEHVRTLPVDRPPVKIVNGPHDQPDDPLHDMFPGLKFNSALFFSARYSW